MLALNFFNFYTYDLYTTQRLQHARISNYYWSFPTVKILRKLAPSTKPCKKPCHINHREARYELKVAFKGVFLPKTITLERMHKTHIDINNTTQKVKTRKNLIQSSLEPVWEHLLLLHLISEERRHYFESLHELCLVREDAEDLWRDFWVYFNLSCFAFKEPP